MISNFITATVNLLSYGARSCRNFLLGKHWRRGNFSEVWKRGIPFPEVAKHVLQIFIMWARQVPKITAITVTG